MSDSDANRESADASFAALGFEQLVLKIIQTKRDTAGRAVVESIKETRSSDVTSVRLSTKKIVPKQRIS